MLSNYPNPFNAITTISFVLHNSSDVSLEVYNISGQRIKAIINDYREAGEHNIIWDGKDVSGGLLLQVRCRGVVGNPKNDFDKSKKKLLNGFNGSIYEAPGFFLGKGRILLDTS